jgi:hypothetical protein
LKKIEDIRKEQREQAKKSKPVVKEAVISAIAKNRLNQTEISSIPHPMPDVQFPEKDNSLHKDKPNPLLAAAQSTAVETNFHVAEKAGNPESSIEIRQEVVTQETLSKASKLNSFIPGGPTILAVPAHGANTINAANIERDIAIGLAEPIPDLNMIESLNPIVEAAVAQQLPAASKPDIIKEGNELSTVEKRAIEDRLLNIHRSFALVTERLEVYEEALATRNELVSGPNDEGSAPKSIKEFPAVEQGSRSRKEDLIVGVENMLELSKKRKDLEKMNEAAFKIQMFYKKQRFGRGPTKKHRSTSPNKSPKYAHIKNQNLQKLLLKAQVMHRETAKDKKFENKPTEKVAKPSVQCEAAPNVNVFNTLGLSDVTKHPAFYSAPKPIIEELKLQANPKPKAVEEMPFIIPQNFKHSILNLYTKYIAKNSAKEMMGLKSADQYVPKMQNKTGTDPENIALVPQPETILIDASEKESANNFVATSPKISTNTHNTAQPQFASAGMQTDMVISDLSEFSELATKPHTSFSSITSPSRNSKSRGSGENVKLYADYENDSFESILSAASDAASSSSPPLKQRIEPSKPFAPGDVFARQKREMMVSPRIFPQSLGKRLLDINVRFDLELQNFIAPEHQTEPHKNRAVAISEQDNTAYIIFLP